MAETAAGLLDETGQQPLLFSISQRWFRVKQPGRDLKRWRDPRDGVQAVRAMVLIDEPLTRTVIGAFYAVYNKLAYGFLENVYGGALEHECAKRGLHVGREVPVAVHYDGIIAGSYRVDLLVERRLVIEIKAIAPSQEHFRQLLNYLRCSDLELGLLLYFDRRPLVKRFIYRNQLKVIHEAR